MEILTEDSQGSTWAGDGALAGRPSLSQSTQHHFCQSCVEAVLSSTTWLRTGAALSHPPLVCGGAAAGGMELGARASTASHALPTYGLIACI